MNMGRSSESKSGLNLIFACSGAADVGETTEKASDILAIDGYPLNCTKNCLEQAGFENFKHLQLADMGLEKGNSPASDENISIVIKEVADLMN